MQKSKPQCNMVSIFLLAKFLPSTVPLWGMPRGGTPLGWCPFLCLIDGFCLIVGVVELRGGDLNLKEIRV